MRRTRSGSPAPATTSSGESTPARLRPRRSRRGRPVGGRGGSGSVWVANAAAGTVSRIDPRRTRSWRRSTSKRACRDRRRGRLPVGHRPGSVTPRLLEADGGQVERGSQDDAADAPRDERWLVEHVDDGDRRGVAGELDVERRVGALAPDSLREPGSLSQRPVVRARREAREVRRPDEPSVEEQVDVRVRVDVARRPQAERDVPRLTRVASLLKYAAVALWIGMPVPPPPARSPRAVASRAGRPPSGAGSVDIEDGLGAAQAPLRELLRARQVRALERIDVRVPEPGQARGQVLIARAAHVLAAGEDERPAVEREVDRLAEPRIVAEERPRGVERQEAQRQPRSELELACERLIPYFSTSPRAESK